MPRCPPNVGVPPHQVAAAADVETGVRVVIGIGATSRIARDVSERDMDGRDHLGVAVAMLVAALRRFGDAGLFLHASAADRASVAVDVVDRRHEGGAQLRGPTAEILDRDEVGWTHRLDTEMHCDLGGAEQPQASSRVDRPEGPRALLNDPPRLAITDVAAGADQSTRLATRQHTLAAIAGAQDAPCRDETLAVRPEGSVRDLGNDLDVFRQCGQVACDHQRATTLRAML